MRITPAIVILNALRQAADAEGRVTMTDRQLAALAGYRQTRSVNYGLAALRHNGRITDEPAPGTARGSVIILSQQ